MPTTVSGVKNNIWRKQQNGLYAPSRMNFPLDGLAAYFPLWEPSQESLLNGTGIATGVPMVLVGPGAQTITVTQAGTFLIYLPKGATGTATAGTMAVTGSPVALVGGLNTITTTGAVGNFTVAVPTIISKDLNAYVGTIVGATQVPQGRLFDPTDDSITFGDTSTLAWMHGKGNTTAFKWTVLVWFNQLHPGTAYAVFLDTSALDSSKTGITVFVDTSRKPRIIIYRGGAGTNVINFTPAGTYPNNTAFHCLAFTYDQSLPSANANFFLAGAWVEAGDKGVGAPNDANASYAPLMGRYNGPVGAFDGTLGEMLIFNRVLSAGEINHYYQATKGMYS